MEVDDDKSMEEMGFVPSGVSDSAGWRELLRVKNTCGKKCEKESFKFYGLASIVEEEDGKPHTINLRTNCSDSRLTESGESKVTNAVWKEMIRQKTSRGRLRAAFGSDGFLHKKVGAFYDQEEVGKAFAGRSNEFGAEGDRQQLAQ